MNKSVFITGAASGTGYAIAERFAKEGYDVFIGSRNEENAVNAAQKLHDKFGIFAKGYKTEIGCEENVKAVFTDIRNMGYLLDTLVLNAANLGIGQDTSSVSIEDFKDVYKTNVFGNFMLAREAALQMKEKKKGSIVFVNSNTAYRAVPQRCAYSSSKSAILGMSRCLAVDLGKYGIRSNCVLPGMIKTVRWETNYNDCKNALSNYTPIGDISDFSDIANAVWYFGSDESKNATGAELTVDGGNMVQLTPDIKR